MKERRTMYGCDRCRVQVPARVQVRDRIGEEEIESPPDRWVQVGVRTQSMPSGKTSDLCGSCAKQLDDFLHGAPLDT